MALSYDEMQQLFEQIGFKGFSMRPYDAKWKIFFPLSRRTMQKPMLSM